MSGLAERSYICSAIHPAARWKKSSCRFEPFAQLPRHTQAGTDGNVEWAVINDGKKVSRGGGILVQELSGELRAARLVAIKSDILNNLRQTTLSIHGMASRHGVAIRYLRALFAADGTTFTKFVLQQRLAAAHAMLSDMRSAERTIGAIAFEVGFGDLADFNRAFRRRYGVKPLDVRDKAHLKNGG
jgi:AraC-like DNA-binding protein